MKNRLQRVLTQEAIPGDADCKSATRLRRITNPA